MEKFPKISVIMGIYNCADTLEEALDSLLAQTCQDFKVIMCNDGSKDNTALIAQRYVSRYPNKFILIENERNMGLNFTLNHCLKYVDTKYVARMDGDDISLPDRFETELGFLENHPDIAIVSTPMSYFDENGVFRNGNGGGDRIVTKNDFVNGTPFCHAPCMVRTHAYNAVGGYSVDPRLLRVEDYHLWFKMYAKGFKGYVIDKITYMMRDDRNAVARRTWKNRFNEFYVRRLGYSMLSLPWYKRVYIFRPIAVGLLPKVVYKFFHNR